MLNQALIAKEYGFLGDVAYLDISLTSMPPMYDADPGKINPHKFIPHDSKDPAKFPECTTCHTPHPLPPPKGFKDKSANVEMCYSCHHNYTFQKCSGYHK